MFQVCFKYVSTFKSVSESFKDISQMFRGHFKKDRRVSQGSFQWVSWAFERISKVISVKFQRYFEDVSKKFQGYYKKVFMVLQGSFKIGTKKFLCSYLQEASFGKMF